MFDNRGSHDDTHCADDCSRGLHLKLDYKAMTAKVVAEYYHPRTNLSSGALCGYTTLPSENVLLAWGTNPCITEHTSDGAIAMDIQVSALGKAGSHLLYRAYKDDWKSTPPWDPRIAIQQGNVCGESTHVTVYVSWNGATEMKAWEIVSLFHHTKTSRHSNLISDRLLRTRAIIPNTTTVQLPALIGRASRRPSP